MQPPTDSMQCVQVGISVFPTIPPPPPPPPPGIPAKLLAVMQKYLPGNWRLDQLSKPKAPITAKFVAEVVKPRYDKKKEIKLTDEIQYYADHMSRPLLKTLVINKGLFGKLKGPKYVKKVRKRIAKSWASMYNFYKKNARDRRRRKLRMEQKAAEEMYGKKKKKEFNRTASLAMPKQVFKPKPPKRKPKPKKIFSNFRHLELLASPKSHHEEKPMREGLNPAALTCVPSEHTCRLAQQPERFQYLPKPLELGKVRKSALTYKISPRIAALAVARPRSEKVNTDEDSGPWTISKSALTYKATPRIIELAKPIERD